MLITIKELRTYIRNALSPARSDREQLGSLGSPLELGPESNLLDDEIETPQHIDDPGKIVIDDPYVNQDQPPPTIGGRKFGRTF